MPPAPVKCSRAVDRSTPGCLCSRCHRLRERFRKATGGTIAGSGPVYNNNMGRIQHGAVERGWQDGGTDFKGEYKFGHLRGHEAADREEREAYRRPLPAAYRYMLGPVPHLTPSDTVGARQYLNRILGAIEVGGWTRSEWSRLYRMRDKWKARAEGKDPRFNIAGNYRGGLNSRDRGTVKTGRAVADIERTTANGGSKKERG